MNNYYNNNRTSYNRTNSYNSRNSYNNYEKHPEHPIRNAFFCVFCVFFTFAFNYLWVCQLIDFDYTDHAIAISVVILICAVFGGVCSFVKSHKSYFLQRKRNKRVRNKHAAYRKRLKNRYYR